MNTLLLLSLLANGTFVCVQGNNTSICDQKIKFYENSISVIYDGECAGQGPYKYICDGSYCQDEFGIITFDFLDKDNYRWENKKYGFFCEFKRII
jgi:hypothetical protein